MSFNAFDEWQGRVWKKSVLFGVDGRSALATLNFLE